MPWDALANRFGRYLELTYVATTLAGLVIAAELTVLILPGDASYKRLQLTNARRVIESTKLTTLQILLITIGLAVFAYLVGRVAQRVVGTILSRAVMLWEAIDTLWGWRTNWLDRMTNLLHSVQVALADRWNSFESVQASLARRIESVQASLARWNSSPRRSGAFDIYERYSSRVDGIGADGRYYNLRRRRDRIAYFFSFLMIPRLRASDLLVELSSLEMQSVKSVLSKHPIDVATVEEKLYDPGPMETRYDDELDGRMMFEIWRSSDYCARWLRRNAPEVNLSQMTQLAVPLPSSAAALILAPFAADAINYDLGIFSNRIVVSLLALWLIVLAQRIWKRYPLVVFKTFVVTALVADNSPEQPPKTGVNDSPK